MNTFVIKGRGPDTKLRDSIEKFQGFFKVFAQNINSSGLYVKTVDNIFDSLVQLLNEYNELTIMFLTSGELSSNKEIIDVLQKSLNIVQSEIRTVNTKYKRDKLCRENDLFVKSEEKAIGLKWVMTPDPAADVPFHSKVENKFSYVPILKTLNSFFLEKRSRELYLSHNERKPDCVPGVYDDFCCGERCKNSNFFQESYSPIQLQLAIDDFEVCSPLKSKTKIHKIRAVYMQIRNLPRRFLSKLNNIYLVLLCETANLKQEYTGLDNLLELIVTEIKELETKGITIPGDINLKGTLVNFCFDNLGGNETFGFTESFNSRYYCRICTTPRTECYVSTKEISANLRNLEDYNDCIEKLKNEEKIDLTETKGVKKYCLLNNLENFHVLLNMSLDIMHDLNEGLVPITLKYIFMDCINKKILTKSQLIAKIRDYPYYDDAKNKPSALDIDKDNLGQNATQMRYLLLNLPFILMDYREELSSSWICIETCLKIMQILYSDRITEDELLILEDTIDLYLTNMIKIFKIKLTPKLHFLTHYPNLIRKMGPVIHTSTMRFEGKHKTFTDFAKKTNNFINITKTLTEKHQQNQLAVGFTYEDSIVASKKQKPVRGVQSIEIFKSVDDELNETRELNFLHFNNYTYRPGKLIIYNNQLNKILHVVSYRDQYWFICTLCRKIKYNNFCNSIEFDVNANLLNLINLNDLENKCAYNVVKIKDVTYVKCETLSFKSIM